MSVLYRRRRRLESQLFQWSSYPPSAVAFRMAGPADPVGAIDAGGVAHPCRVVPDRGVSERIAMQNRNYQPRSNDVDHGGYLISHLTNRSQGPIFRFGAKMRISIPQPAVSQAQRQARQAAQASAPFENRRPSKRQ